MAKRDSKERLGRLLRDANLAWRTKVYGRMAEKGFPDIRPAHSPVFRFLPSEGARTVDLAASAGITKQSMGYLVKALENAGYVELVKDPADGRAQLVRYTAKGAEADKLLSKTSSAFEREFVERIGAKDVQSTKEALAKIISD